MNIKTKFIELSFSIENNSISIPRRFRDTLSHTKSVNDLVIDSKLKVNLFPKDIIRFSKTENLIYI